VGDKGSLTTTYTGKVEMQQDGSVRMYTAPTIPEAQADGDYKTYQRVGNDWKLIFYKHQIPNPTRGSRNQIVWMEESWAADGSKYTQDVWAVKDHSGAKENDGWHFSRTVMEGGRATTTFYHTQILNGRDIPYMWGSAQYYAHDAQVTYVHSVDANGKLGEMLTFNLIPDGRVDWGNTWTKKDGWDTNSGGWPYGQGGRGRPVEPGVQYDGDHQIGLPVHLNPGGGETVSTLPFLTIQAQSKNGTYVETISDKGHTQAIQFVYSGEDKKELIQQTYGHMENGQWVQTTTRSKDLVTRLTDRLKAGGNKVDPPSVQKTADGFAVTFHVETPEIHWDIDTNPYFIQNWSGDVTLEFKRVGTVDGVDQYSLVKVTSDVSWWHQRNDGIWHRTDNQPLSRLGVTEADFQALVSSWNERAVL
jgi:hypothetical protein